MQFTDSYLTVQGSRRVTACTTFVASNIESLVRRIVKVDEEKVFPIN